MSVTRYDGDYSMPARKIRSRFTAILSLVWWYTTHHGAKPSHGRIDELNHLRSKHSGWRLAYLGPLSIRDPYSYPVTTYFWYATWHLCVMRKWWASHGSD